MSLLTDLYTWHCKLCTDICYSLIYYRQVDAEEEEEGAARYTLLLKGVLPLPYRSLNTTVLCGVLRE